MTTRTGQAQILADALREPGHGAAQANARAWRARCHPEATRGLVAAAMVLTDGDAGAAMWSAAEACPDDRTLLGWAADLEASLAELLKHCRDMKAACEAELETALTERAKAAAAARAAQARMAAAATPQLRDDAERDYELAMERVRAADLVIADCEAALEILAAAEGKLAHALNAVRQVPADLQETYEAPYELVRRDGRKALPHDGDFLTGSAA